MKKKNATLSYEKLIEENKQEILNDKSALEKIDKKIDERYIIKQL